MLKKGYGVFRDEEEDEEERPWTFDDEEERGCKIILRFQSYSIK
jgi:hypothetical protein